MAKNLKELEKLLQKKIASALKNEVAKESVKTMRENVQSEVYDKYSPSRYERSGDLMEDIDVGVIDDNTIYVENVRYEDGKDIAKVIETGEGYDYLPPKYNPYDEDGNTYLTPRPFTEVTRQELSDGKAKDALMRGLKRQGLNVQD